MINGHFTELTISEYPLMEKRDATKYLPELQLKGLCSHRKPAAE